MLILPNEWILDYLTPGTNKSQLSEIFVEECAKRNHLFLIRRESNFRSKIFRYSRLYRNDTKIGRFVDLVLRNSQLARIIEEAEILRDDFDLSSIPGDDRYLVEVLHSFPTAVLITTDGFLRDRVIDLGLKAVLFRDDVNLVLKAAEAF